MFPIQQVLLSDTLSTYDPYDIWKTSFGLKIKDVFNNYRLIGVIPALVLTLTDLLINNELRLGYKKQEYPIVRALAAQILLNKYAQSKDKSLLPAVETHLIWLKEHISKGYSGACWGLGFKWPAASNVIYDENTPHATHTPYALEAFHRYTFLVNNYRFVDLIKSCFQFYEKDLCVMYEDEKMMAVSYGPFKDRIATNAVSYVMYSYAIFLSYLPDKEEYIKVKIKKLYQFIIQKQQENGSWLYIPDDKNSFIDCFHSCFILKNLIKTQKIVALDKVSKIIEKGYSFICDNFYDEKTGLYKRFTKTNKPSLIKFDLYDNAEMLGLCNMMKDENRLFNLDAAIKRYFIRGNDIYSARDFLGRKRNKNTLRWASMPYLYTLSTLQ